FGTRGVVITPTGINSSSAESVAVQADGKIVVVGYGGIVRYNPNGSLDTSFNGTGIVFTSGASKAVLQPDGKIVALGSVSTGINTSAFALARYNADGSLDSGFGVGGKVIHAVCPCFGGILDAVLQPDGKIVASGYFIESNDYNSRTAIVRYNTN